MATEKIMLMMEMIVMMIIDDDEDEEEEDDDEDNYDDDDLYMKYIGVLRDTARAPKPTTQYNTIQYHAIPFIR